MVYAISQVAEGRIQNPTPIIRSPFFITVITHEEQSLIIRYARCCPLALLIIPIPQYPGLTHRPLI